MRKQEWTVADHSGTSRLVLWQEHIGLPKKEKSYALEEVTVNRYEGRKYLTVSERSKSEEIDDIGAVAEVESDEDGTSRAPTLPPFLPDDPVVTHASEPHVSPDRLASGTPVSFPSLEVSPSPVLSVVLPLAL